eukprot:gnl/Carplike_NY0171/10245_a14415_131.p1 GENE.gnl/Carplike_NY0171/10245_a14415_131~~gnl/Carplike_NY0171/10245_a14415_131.p1  ORF type:complete len:164 (-),score=34.45 gnl/Carplike_NY0171/10245_a14415_131:98-532(-)
MAEGRRKDGYAQNTPLPKSGACKHYKKSHRYFRFPCCGLSFPCDLCHEAAITDGHAPLPATHTICGFCSHEWKINPNTHADTHCPRCGKSIRKVGMSERGVVTKHWEGGAGCRDKTQLSRKDKRKHSGKGKIQSRKARIKEERK